jgi:hypothetical protein
VTQGVKPQYCKIIITTTININNLDLDWGMDQVVKHLLSKYKALSSHPTTENKKI